MPDSLDSGKRPTGWSIRELSRRRETVRVLVSVKASPQPSAAYGDTVCVAGTLMDTLNPRWIRLYPVPFRYLDGPQRFSKYSVIDVELREATQDQRPESAKINTSSVQVGETLPPWEPRARWIEPLSGPTMCQMQRAAKADVNAPSLGAIRPYNVDPELIFEQHGPWTTKQQRALDAAASQGSLFGPAPPRMLQPPRFRVNLHFWCHEPGCGGHSTRIIDWELTALQAHGFQLGDASLKTSVTDKLSMAKWKSPLVARKSPRPVAGFQGLMGGCFRCCRASRMR